MHLQRTLLKMVDLGKLIEWLPHWKDQFFNIWKFDKILPNEIVTF